MSNILNKITWNKVFLPISAFIAALVCSGVFIRLFGYSPISVYRAVLIGAAGTLNDLLQTFSQSTVLILTGLSFAVAFKAGLINIGAEGQLCMGAIAGALAGIYIPFPAVIHHLAVITVAAVFGGLWAVFAGYLKIKFNAHEVITTIMLNTIAVSFASYLVNYPLKSSELLAQSARLRDTAIIKRIIPQTQFNITFIFTVFIVIIVYLIVHKSVFGYELRVVGKNRFAAKASGIKINKMVLMSMGFSGAIAGCAGAFQVMSIDYKIIDGFSSGYGFSGIAVSALASGNVIGMIFSGILFGAFKNGALVVQRISKVPSDFIQVLQAFVIIFIAAPEMMYAIKSFFTVLVKRVMPAYRSTQEI